MHDTIGGQAEYHLLTTSEGIMRRVTIEAWQADDRYTHCHVDGYDGIHAYAGSVVQCSTKEFVAAGLVTGLLRSLGGVYECDNCLTLCDVIEIVLGYSPRQLSDARRQLEDCGADCPDLPDSQVAWLDYSVRELLADHARDVDDPYASDLRAVDQLVAEVTQ